MKNTLLISALLAAMLVTVGCAQSEDTDSATNGTTTSTVEETTTDAVEAEDTMEKDDDAMEKEDATDEGDSMEKTEKDADGTTRTVSLLTACGEFVDTAKIDEDDITLQDSGIEYFEHKDTLYFSYIHAGYEESFAPDEACVQ